MMGLSDGRKSFQIGLAVLIQYRSVTASHPASHPATQPPSHVAVDITLNAKASSLKSRQTVSFNSVTGGILSNAAIQRYCSPRTLSLRKCPHDASQGDRKPLWLFVFRRNLFSLHLADTET